MRTRGGGEAGEQRKKGKEEQRKKGGGRAGPQRAAEEREGEDIPASRAEQSRVAGPESVAEADGVGVGRSSRRMESRTEQTGLESRSNGAGLHERIRTDGRPRAAGTDSREAVGWAAAAAGFEVRRRRLLSSSLLPFPLPLSLSATRWGFGEFGGRCRRDAAAFPARGHRAALFLPA
jgi:hypothetical protein